MLTKSIMAEIRKSEKKIHNSSLINFGCSFDSCITSMSGLLRDDNGESFV